MRVYRPSSCLMRKDSNSSPHKRKEGGEGLVRGGGRQKVSVEEARTGRGNRRENGIKEGGKSQVGLAEELERQENLEWEGQDGAMRGPSNCWVASIWLMNLEAIGYCAGKLLPQNTQRKGTTEEGRGGGRFAAAPFILAGTRPSYIHMAPAHTPG